MKKNNIQGKKNLEEVAVWKKIRRTCNDEALILNIT